MLIESTALETIQALFFALAARQPRSSHVVDTLEYSHFDMADEGVIAMLLGLQS